MDTRRLFAICLPVLMVAACKTSHPTEATGDTPTAAEAVQVLDSVQSVFYEFAQANPASTPQQVLILTAEWVMTQPNVVTATWFDSAYITMTLRSGLQATYAIYVQGSDSLSLTRGGKGSLSSAGNFPAGTNAIHPIVNKSVLIYSPFVGPDYMDLYHSGEIQPLVNKIRNAGKGISVTVLENEKCTIAAIETFKDYGVVIIDTHGLPDGFFSGDVISELSSAYDTTDALVKETLDRQVAGGYEKVVNGDLRFALFENIANIRDWRKFLATKSDSPRNYRLLVNAQFIDKLPPMPNTIVVGNMCYSGWSRVGAYTNRFGSKFDCKIPMKTAFTNRHPISYYSYELADGLSAPVDNDFAKKMEDTLLSALVLDGDSTGNAHLDASGGEFTAGALGNVVSPGMPFRLTGSVDYSFDECVDVFTDERDGAIYKAACIEKQVWMAENLRYNAAGSECNPAVDCRKYGRHYDHATVMNGAAASSADPSGIRGICPKGWHLPSLPEWLRLAKAAGGEASAGGALKATTDWTSPNTGATDKYGFSGLPGGLYYADSSVFYFTGNEGEWWATDDGNKTDSHSGVAMVNYGATFIYGTDANPDPGNKKSCRCLKD
jgi:uncharacterized protein (TIGR02145 family)